MNIYDELNTVFRQVFDDNEITVNANTTSNDIEEWDSLSHVNLVVAVEKHFKIKFRDSEILKWKNVGQMVEAIQARLNPQSS